MNDVGWISLHRKIQDCFLWDIKPFSWGQAWIDLLLMANHKDAKIVFDGNLVTVGMGQRITSIRKLADRWGWSRTKVTNFLNTLEEEQMIKRSSDTKKTLLTIVNYEKYQDVSENESHRKATEKPQKSTNNNDNNENNENKYNTPLTPLGEMWGKRSNKENLTAYLNSGEYPNTQTFKDNPKLYEVVKEWMIYKDARKPKSSNHYANENSMKIFLNRVVSRVSESGVDAVIGIIEDSMSNNYAGITWDKIAKQKQDGWEAFRNAHR